MKFVKTYQTKCKIKIRKRKPLQFSLKHLFFMSKVSIVARRRGCQLATSAPVLCTALGKPSTWFPRGRLVEQSRQDKTQKRRQKARTEKENPPATAAAHKKSPPRPRLFRGELLFAAHCWYLWPALPVPLPLPFCPHNRQPGFRASDS